MTRWGDSIPMLFSQTDSIAVLFFDSCDKACTMFDSWLLILCVAALGSFIDSTTCIAQNIAAAVTAGGAELKLLSAECKFTEGPVVADEEKVPLDKIPKAVADALRAKFPKAKIDKCTKDKEGDEVVYDIEFKEDERKCEADIKENGDYINFEKAIEAKKLPKAVSDAIEKRYPKSILKEIMEETQVKAKKRNKGNKEKLSAYEVVLDTTDKKEVEVRVSPKGKILEDTGTQKPKKKK